MRRILNLGVFIYDNQIKLSNYLIDFVDVKDIKQNRKFIDLVKYLKACEKLAANCIDWCNNLIYPGALLTFSKRFAVLPFVQIFDTR